MAKLRTVPYGYEICNGVVAVQPREAEIVREIFSLYISGSTLQSISENLIQKSIPFYQGEVRWNKCSVKQIIDNVKYIGGDAYPQIVPEDVFGTAQRMKDGKGGAAISLSPILEYFKDICVCGKCGTRFKRINTWGAREKWMCADGCKTLLFVTDETLETAVLNTINRVIQHPELLDVPTNSHYTPSKEVVREENELIRLLEQPKISFTAAAKSILQCAALRFECCSFDRGEVTEELKDEFAETEPINELDLQFVRRYIRKIKVYPNGRLTIVFYNSAEITAIGGKDDGSCSTEESNED